jgi:alpha-glucosidase
MPHVTHSSMSSVSQHDSKHSERHWWRSAVVYQIYPWSFQDSNGDGIGDLQGIIQRLDYLNDGRPLNCHSAGPLGIDAIWLSPVYPSPMKDFGYDVSDYCAIDPRFGSLRDFDRLLMEAHRRGIRVLMDLVLNHTSDQHPWFIDSRSSRHSGKREWYLWADAKAGGPPSNWRAVFGGSAWEWDAGTRQYYLHSFLKEQPDLNWANPEVRQAMFQVVRFWLDRGVDGFRLDAINWIGKDLQWTDNPRGRLTLRSYLRQMPRYSRDQPETHEALKALRQALKPYPHAVLVGEASSDTPGGPAAFYGSGDDELQLVFNFRLLKSAWRAEQVRQFVRDWDGAVPVEGWPTQVLSNHDQSRHWDRYGRGGIPDRRARAAAVLLLTLRGTPFLYYGEEIGMRDVKLKYRELRDPYTRRYWPFLKGRDRARTPMQWDATPAAGFTTGTPWLPVSPDWSTVNVARSQGDSRSLLALYRQLIAIRKASPALNLGTLQCLDEGPADCLIYVRESCESGTSREIQERIVIAINFSAQMRRVAITAFQKTGHLLLSSDPHRGLGPINLEQVVLGPDEAVVVRLD